MVKMTLLPLVFQELLSFIPSMQKGEPTWEELKQFGAGWWINNISILKRVIVKVIKCKLLIWSTTFVDFLTLMNLTLVLLEPQPVFT